MKKAFIFIVFMIVAALSSADAAGVELFVQTGHTGGVHTLAVSPAGKAMVSLEDGYPGHLKIWDVTTAMEIRTIEMKIPVTTIVFIDEDTFMIYSSSLAEIYNLQGRKTEVIHYPQGRAYRNPVVGRDRQHLFADLFPESGHKKIYGMKDGKEILLPEVSRFGRYDRAGEDVADLGYGYYGIFYKEQTDKGNAGFVIYDDSLKVIKRGALNITDLYASKFRVSADLKYLAYHKTYNHQAPISVCNLETGKSVFSYAPRPLRKAGGDMKADERLDFDFLPDGRLRVEYVQWIDNPQHNLQMATTVRMEVVMLSPAANGGYTEKKIILDNLDQSGLFGDTRSYAITADGALLAGLSDGSIWKKDLNTGANIRSFGVKTFVFRNSRYVGSRLLNWAEESSPDQYFRLRYNLWDMDEARLKQMDVTTETGVSRKPRTIGDSYYPDNPISSDPARLYSRIPSEFLEEGYQRNEYYGRFQSMFFLTKDTGELYTEGNKYSAALLSGITKAKLADLYTFSDGEWIIITPAGYYNASAGGDRYLSVRIGNNVYSIGNYRESFFRPDLVKIAVKGNALEGYKTLADMGTPPAVQIENLPAETAADTVNVRVRITDTGGGIGDVRLYLNDTSIMAESTRSVQVKKTGTQNELVRSYPVKLVSGENVIRAVAFDGENHVQSNPAVSRIRTSYKTVVKPVLYAVVIGINEYKNPKLTLQYAVADAQLFAGTLKKSASGLFDRVEIKVFTTKETTTAVNIAMELKTLKRIKPDDLFVFYVASHGVVDDGEYFLITSNVGLTRTEKLKIDALSQTELKELIANIPATKKLIVLDTCNAGAAGNAIQVAMLTRGMSEDTAIKILSRAVGSTILSAATSSQEALEGYKGHGLFTWVLTQGLSGKADKGKSGYIKTTDIADYVGEEVPNLAEQVFKRAQYPTISISGQGFPIGKVK